GERHHHADRLRRIALGRNVARREREQHRYQWGPQRDPHRVKVNMFIRRWRGVKDATCGDGYFCSWNSQVKPDGSLTNTWSLATTPSIWSYLMRSFLRRARKTL